MNYTEVIGAPPGAAPVKAKAKEKAITKKAWFWPAVLVGVGGVGFAGYKVFHKGKKR